MLATYLKLSPGEARPRAAGWCGDSRLTIGFIQAPIASIIMSLLKADQDGGQSDRHLRTS